MNRAVRAAAEIRLARVRAGRWLEDKLTPPAIWDDPRLTGNGEEAMQHGITINYATLSPADKLKIMEEMGFKEIPAPEHGTNCTSRQGRGLICDCLQGVTTWGAPQDVKRWLGETHEQRAEFASRRHLYLNDGEGMDPGPWFVHLEKTAPRYRH